VSFKPWGNLEGGLGTEGRCPQSDGASVRRKGGGGDGGRNRGAGVGVGKGGGEEIERVSGDGGGAVVEEGGGAWLLSAPGVPKKQITGPPSIVTA
jgi:hypothetical protein